MIEAKREGGVLPYTLNGMTGVTFSERVGKTESLQTAFYPTLGKALLEMDIFLNADIYKAMAER